MTKRKKGGEINQNLNHFSEFLLPQLINRYVSNKNCLNSYNLHFIDEKKLTFSKFYKRKLNI